MEQFNPPLKAVRFLLPATLLVLLLAPTLVSGQQSQVSLQLLKKFEGLASGSDLGISSTFVGDVDLDGVPDILVGAPSASPGGRAGAGSVLLYSGRTYALLHEFDGQNAGDDLGVSVAGIGDVDVDGVPDLLLGADGADPGNQADAGSVMVYSGRDFTLLTRLDGEAAEDLFGTSLGTIGDLNGDGRPEFAVGAVGVDPSALRTNAGRTYVYSGTLVLLARLNGTAAQDDFGISVAGVGDVNGDGRPDFAVGADLTNPAGQVNAGSIYLFSGLDFSLLRRFDGGSPGDFFGTSVSGVGDANGDGRPDLLVGAPAADPGGRTDAGSAYLFSGLDFTLLQRVNGTLSGDDFGWSVGGVGDVSGDGSSDFTVGEDLADPLGRVDAGRVVLYSGRDYTILGEVDGETSGDNLGWSVASDGQSHLLIGAPFNSPGGLVEAGASYLYRASTSNMVPIADFSFSPSKPLVGESVGFDASASYDPDGTIVSYQWSLGDGSSETGKTFSHGYALSGDYTVTLTAEDSGGAMTSTAKMVQVLASPTVSASSDTTGGIVPLSVSFTASARGGLGPYAYAWDFGDGQTATGSSASHRYGSPGSYEAKVTATDSLGHTASDKIVITIVQQPAQPGQPTAMLGPVPAVYVLYGLVASLAALLIMAFLYLTRSGRGKQSQTP